MAEAQRLEAILYSIYQLPFIQQTYKIEDNRRT